MDWLGDPFRNTVGRGTDLGGVMTRKGLGVCCGSTKLAHSRARN